MFFLGISAHLIIYLLVPAFLMICLCITGPVGSPEVPIILPVCITFEPSQHSTIDRESYYYTEAEQQEDQLKVKVVLLMLISPPLITSSTVYAQKTENNKHLLRAPPLRF